MEQTSLELDPEKLLDESRQGEVFTSGKLNQVSQNARKLYLESYGCAMNFSDSEIVASVMGKAGFTTISTHEEADVILINTCAIRDNAEQRIRQRLKDFNKLKKKNKKLMVGVLGCMAERLKTQLLEEEKIVDIVAGPDAYRDLPNLITEVEEGQKAINVLLSREETYADINPIRLTGNGISAYISIMRGCDNMCSFCVVPFTRGRERSRDLMSILEETKQLKEAGYKEITLLGQNVDSYLWEDTTPHRKVTFAILLDEVAKVSEGMRIRFSTSHPKDITDEVLYTMKKHDNICNSIHLPFQSGSSRILELMNRTYTREWYLERVASIRRILGEDCGLSADIITGFCTETEADHQETLSLILEVGFDHAFMFAYSERPGTLAARQYEDDIPLKTKKRRLSEVIEVQAKHAHQRNLQDVGKVHRVLVERHSKKSDAELSGRNDSNKVVVFPGDITLIGSYVDVLVTRCTSATLLGELS